MASFLPNFLLAPLLGAEPHLGPSCSCQGSAFRAGGASWLPPPPGSQSPAVHPSPSPGPLARPGLSLGLCCPSCMTVAAGEQLGQVET